jgi:hypothetical protein
MPCVTSVTDVGVLRLRTDAADQFGELAGAPDFER